MYHGLVAYVVIFRAFQQFQNRPIGPPAVVPVPPSFLDARPLQNLSILK